MTLAEFVDLMNYDIITGVAAMTEDDLLAFEDSVKDTLVADDLTLADWWEQFDFFSQGRDNA